MGKVLIGCEVCGKNMTITPLLQPNAYNNINNTLHSGFIAVAMESTQIASKEIPVDDIKDVIASFDGTWQKRTLKSSMCFIG